MSARGPARWLAGAAKVGRRQRRRQRALAHGSASAAGLADGIGLRGHCGARALLVGLAGCERGRLSERAGWPTALTPATVKHGRAPATLCWAEAAAAPARPARREQLRARRQQRRTSLCGERRKPVQRLCECECECECVRLERQRRTTTQPATAASERRPHCESVYYPARQCESECATKTTTT